MSSQHKNGLIQVYFGRGKGKTTAALGLAFRAAGRGFQVHVIQFMKGFEYGELHSAKKSKLFEITQFGGPDLIADPSQTDIEMGQAGLEFARTTILGQKCDMVILDEIGMAIEHSIIDVNAVLELLDRKPSEVELIFIPAAMCNMMK